MLGFFPVAAAPLASLGLAVTLAASAGADALTGEAVAWQRTVTHEAGAYALTGQDAELDPSLYFRCQTGDFTVTGQSAAQARSVVHAAGSYATTGHAATFRLGIGAATLPFALTGEPATLNAGVAIVAGPGAFTLTGQAVRGGYVLRADAARLRSTGAPEAPLASIPIATLGPAAPESLTGFVLGGYGVALRLSRRAGTGAYHLTGYPVRFIRGPISRGRGVDRSGPLVLVLDSSAAAVRVIDRSAAAIAVRDASEGLP